MADTVNFRWRKGLPDVQPNLVDPEGVRSAMASQGMQGYAPAQGMQGYVPDMGGYSAQRDAVTEIASLERELADIDRRIALIDAEYPQLGSATSNELEIAAKRAEAGDMSAYNAILSRQMGSSASRDSASSAIDNMLYEAEKSTYGLESKSEEERKIARSVIDATLRRAREMAGKAGIPLPDSYARLADAMQKSDEFERTYTTDTAWSNSLWSKARKGELTDSDIGEIDDYIDEHPNAELSKNLRQLRQEYAPKTKESKATAAAEKKEADELYITFSDFGSRWDQAKWFRGLTDRQKRILKKHHPGIDEVTGEEK